MKFYFKEVGCCITLLRPTLWSKSGPSCPSTWALPWRLWMKKCFQSWRRFQLLWKVPWKFKGAYAGWVTKTMQQGVHDRFFFNEGNPFLTFINLHYPLVFQCLGRTQGIYMWFSSAALETDSAGSKACWWCKVGTFFLGWKGMRHRVTRFKLPPIDWPIFLFMYIYIYIYGFIVVLSPIIEARISGWKVMLGFVACWAPFLNALRLWTEEIIFLLRA